MAISSRLTFKLRSLLKLLTWRLEPIYSHVVHSPGTSLVDNGATGSNPLGAVAAKGNAADLAEIHSDGEPTSATGPQT